MINDLNRAMSTPSGRIFLVNDGKFEELFILNFWTKSATGCSCKFGSETNCACCHHGGCVCSYEVGTCVQCGLENDASKCSKKNLELGSVFGFSKSTLSQVILIMKQEKSLLFFEYNLESKYLLEVSHAGKPMTIDLPNKIEDVFYEEILTFGLDGLGKRRFLFVISKLGASNSCYEIIIDSDQENFYLRKILDFSLKGRNIKVFNMHGKIFIGYITKDEMFHLEQFEVYDEKAILNQFLQLNNYKVETWDYLEGSRCYILLKEGDYERVLLFDEATQSLIFHQNILAKSVQKILPVTAWGKVCPMGQKWPANARNLAHDQEKNIRKESISLKTKISRFYIKISPSKFQRVRITEVLIFISNGILDFYLLDHNNKFESVNTHKFDEKYVLSRTSTYTFNNTLYLLMTSASGSDLYRIFLTEGEENVDYSGETLKKFQELKELFDYQITSLESLEQELEDFLSYKKKNLAKEMSKDTFDSIQLSLESLEHNINLVKKSLETAEVFLEDYCIHSVNIFPDVVPKTREQKKINDETPIKGRKTFLGKSEVKDLHTKTLNGVDMENFMTVNKPVEIGKSYLH
ncbi:hypothetical protein Avbf_09366 [Armadillidium vulgare]|nr:hypothetical protein Avbf_09366 [Armadillidium vulgare]